MRPDLDDAGVEVPIARDDPGLAAGEADGLLAAGMNGDGEERHGDALAGRHEHVELAAGRLGGAAGAALGDGAREGEEAVCGLAHGADDDHDVVPRALGGDDAVRDLSELCDIGDGGAAVFLDDDAHAANLAQGGGHGELSTDGGVRLPDHSSSASASSPGLSGRYALRVSGQASRSKGGVATSFPSRTE